MRRLLALLLLGAAGVLATAPAAAHASPNADRVVVVAAPGLRWSDVGPATPALYRLARTQAVGALSVKAGPPVSCVADGLLTLGAGARATAYGVPCGQVRPVDDELRRRNRDSREAADVGLLSRALSDAGTCLQARGARSQALLAPRHRAPATAGAALPRGCRVEVVDGPVVAGSGLARAASAAAVDALVAAEEQRLGATGVLVVVGVSGARGDDAAHLHVALMTRHQGALRSASTRRAPYVQLIDVAPTVLDLLDVAQPAAMVGQPWRAVGETPTPKALADLDRKAQGYRTATVPFVVASLALLLAGLLATRRRPRALHAVALAGAALPGASYLAMLVPWWRADPAAPALLAVVLALAAALAAAAERVPGRLGPLAAVLVGTALLVVADLVSGAHLQMEAPFGYSALVAGRFAGIGNVALGVLAACALLGAALLPVAAAAALLAVVVLVDGAPPFGSDVGGVLALLPAAVLLLALRTGRRVSLPLVLGSGAAAVLLVSALAALDLSRPPDRRTHLGRFARQLLDGEAGTVLRRKAGAVLDLLFANPVTALLPLVVAAAVLLVVRAPEPLGRAFAAFPAYRQGLSALGLACLLGFVLNDSGAAVPALALVVALPATVAVVSRSGADPGSASLASRTPDESEASG